LARGRGIYKRGTIWWIRYADVNGEIRAESSKSTTYEAAQNLLTDRRKEVQEGKEHQHRKNFTFSDLCDAYEKTLVNPKSKASFIKKLREEFSSTELRLFNTKVVREYQVMMVERCKTIATVNRYMSALKRMFTCAVEFEMVGDDVLRKVRRVQQLQERNQRTRFLSKDEIERLLAVCDSDFKPVVMLALNTGMRKSELLGLQWNKNVDMVHNRISITETKNSQRRDIPINATVKEALAGLVRRLDSPYVFNRSNGHPYKTIDKKWIEVRAKAGLEDVRFHDLRHTFASHLVIAGVGIMVVKELLGHKSLTMTMRYAHLAPNLTEQAVSKLCSFVQTD